MSVLLWAHQFASPLRKIKKKKKNVKTFDAHIRTKGCKASQVTSISQMLWARFEAQRHSLAGASFRL